MDSSTLAKEGLNLSSPGARAKDGEALGTEFGEQCGLGQTVMVECVLKSLKQG